MDVNCTKLRNAEVCDTDASSDAIWILSSTVIIFTMQSGFGLLESGSVSVKNEANIMVKNAVDVIFGGLIYWMFGYGLSFGEQAPQANPFVGWGNFFVQANEEDLGWVYAKFFFQASFATTATTIVSGAMAERTKLEAYMLFSLINTFVYCIPARWVWGHGGWLQTMGVVDIAGAGPVHLVGGTTGLVATLLLKPRHNRYTPTPRSETDDTPTQPPTPRMGSPTNAILGMFMLWWGWLGFNCGSTFGISGSKWKLAARSAVSTICSSIAGGIMGIFLSYITRGRKFEISFLINGILGALVAITASCAIVHPWEGLVIGTVGSLITISTVLVLDKLKVDDPVGCVGTHASGGVWSLVAAGLFSRRDAFAAELQMDSVRMDSSTSIIMDLVHVYFTSVCNAEAFVSMKVHLGGGGLQLGVQLLAVVSILTWTLVVSFLVLKAVDLTVGLRVPLTQELLGADLVEHDIGDFQYNKRTNTAHSCSRGTEQHRDL